MALVSREQLEGKQDAEERMWSEGHTVRAGRKAVGKGARGVGGRPCWLEW